MKKYIPFDFVLDRLVQLGPIIKPMFGCYGVYIGEKIMLILRNRKDHSLDNGVWLATSKEYHISLKKELPSLRSIDLLGNGDTNWQILPLESDDFEESVIRTCELILSGDERIGKIPKPKKKKKGPKKSEFKKNHE